MNWIERMYELKGKDLYSQNGEGLYLEYIFCHIGPKSKMAMDIGGGDGFYLSNIRHLKNIGWFTAIRDRVNGDNVNIDNLLHKFDVEVYDLICVDTDGNDYWFVDKLMQYKPPVIVAEFNPSFTDSRAIKYNPDHVWTGDDYYGFSFAAGVKLAEKHGYKVIFQVADMNMFMVRADLIGDLYIPPVTFKQSNFFKKSDRTDWVMI